MSKLIGVTIGDIQGIGIEILIKEWKRKRVKNFVLITGHFPSSSVRVTDYWISNVSRDILSNKKHLKRHIDSKLEFNRTRKKNYPGLKSH